MKIEKLFPAFKDYLWGGTKLRDVYGKQSDLVRVAESWELSAHPAGESVIYGGEFDGLTFSEYIEKNGKAILGANCADFESFPVLIKFIDARQPLSVQVHPSDEYALRVEGEYGKTEMWYVMDCEDEATLYFGVNRELTKEEFAERIAENTLTEVLNEVRVKKGDVFFIEAGTIHAIGAGIVICEIQQNSNTTYRVYDYGRKDDSGNLRELHVEKALEVSSLTPSDTADKQGAVQKVDGGTKQMLGSCKYFTTKKLEVDGKLELIADEKSFISLVCLDGCANVSCSENTVKLGLGESVFVPAGAGKIELEGKAEIIKTTV